MPPAICDSEDDESDLEIIVPAPKTVGNNKVSGSRVNLQTKKPASPQNTVKNVIKPNKTIQDGSAQNQQSSPKRRKITHEHSPPTLNVANDKLPLLPTLNSDFDYNQGVTQFNRLPMVSQNYVTQPSPVISAAHPSTGLHQTKGPTPQLPQEEPWLQGTLQQEFQQHNPFMFMEASSTVPNDTAPEPLYPFNSQPLPLSQSLHEATLLLNSPAKSSSNDPASIPWSAYLNSQDPKSSDGKVAPNAAKQTSSAKRSQSLLNLLEENVDVTNVGKAHCTEHARTTPLKPKRAHPGASANSEPIPDVWAMPDSPDVLAPAAAAQRKSKPKKSAKKQEPNLVPELMHVDKFLQSVHGSVDGNAPTTSVSSADSAKKRRKTGSRADPVVDATSLETSSRAGDTRDTSVQSSVNNEQRKAGVSDRRGSKRRRTAASSAESVAQLQTMGFDADQADQALTQVAGDLSRAIELLVDQQAQASEAVSRDTAIATPSSPASKRRNKTRAKSPSVEVVSHSKSKARGRPRKNLIVDDAMDEDEVADSEVAVEPVDAMTNAASDEKESPEEPKEVQKPAPPPAAKFEPKKRGRGRPRKAAAGKETEPNITEEVEEKPLTIEETDHDITKVAKETDIKSESKDNKLDADKENQVPTKREQDNADTAKTTKLEPDDKTDIKTPLKGKDAAAKSAKSTGKAVYRVGLSRTARIAPLLRVMRK